MQIAKKTSIYSFIPTIATTRIYEKLLETHRFSFDLFPTNTMTRGIVFNLYEEQQEDL